MYKQAKEAVNFLLGLSDIINKGEWQYNISKVVLFTEVAI